jgi:hypothetical protein
MCRPIGLLLSLYAFMAWTDENLNFLPSYLLVAPETLRIRGMMVPTRIF